MPINLQALIVPLILDSSKYGQGLDAAGTKTDGFGAKMQGVSTKAIKTGAVLTASVTAPLALMGKAAVQASSDLEQSIGGVESVFKDSAGIIFAFGENAAQSVGLSKRAFNEMATVTAALLKNQGFTAEEAANEVIRLTQRAADMAATFGGSTAQAMAAINSGLRGSGEMLEKYGAGMLKSEINARALADTGKELSSELTLEETNLARLALIFERTADSQGQFAREAETLEGITQRNAAEQENLSGELGDVLKPVMVDIALAVGKFMEAFQALSPQVKKIIVIIGVILAVLGPLFVAFGVIVSVVTTLAPVFAAIGAIIGGIAVGPVLLIIGAIALLVGAFLLLRANWDKIVGFLKSTWEGFKNAFKRVVDSISGFISGLLGKLGDIKQKLLDAIPEWLRPGSKTAFEIGLSGIRKELIKVDAELRPTRFVQSLPDVAKARTDEFGEQRDMIDYNRLARTLAHELQLVIG